MKLIRRGAALSLAIMLLSGCATTTAQAPALRYPAVAVPAASETMAVATQMADAADDPAIWTTPAGVDFDGIRRAGIILGTDKKAGLYVFDLGGQSLQFLPDGLLNNVDLRAEGTGFVAAASDRGRMGVALYRFAGSGTLAPAGFLKSDVAEPYGMCMGRWNGALHAILIAKDGGVRIWKLDTSSATITGTEVRRFVVGSQSEGCTVDDATGALFIGEEMTGVWRYSLADDRPRRLVAGVGNGELVPDVEGTTLIRDADATFLIVSSQGDDAFAVWRITADAEAYVGRFRVAAAGAVDGVSGTDGVDAWSGPIGGFGRGLVVTQDDVNTGGAQNFKLVGWAEVRAALER